MLSICSMSLFWPQQYTNSAIMWTDGEWAQICCLCPPHALPYRSGEYWKGHWRHLLLSFLTLQQSTLSVVRVRGWSKLRGRGAETDRKPISIWALHHRSDHLPYS